MRAAVPDKYKPCVAVDKLMALQPNLHNDTTHLPPHFDDPRHDGFGVVIVTVAVAQTGRVVIDTHDKPSKVYTFDANEGDLYVLSDAARNTCDHGVLCPPKSRRRAPKGPNDRGRESLNLRFALHGTKPNQPFFIHDECPSTGLVFEK